MSRLYDHRPSKPRVHRAFRVDTYRRDLGSGRFVYTLTLVRLPGWHVEWTGRNGTGERRWFPRHRDAIDYVSEYRVGAIA